MSNSSIRVRFAPSPTGMMHVGNARTALWSYLFAKKHNGANLLRIEDTDSKRNLDHAVQVIFESTSWLGISFNEEPVYQSKRELEYTRALSFLIDEGYAYKCFCTQERLEKIKQQQQQQGLPPRYDGKCKELAQTEANRMLAEGSPFIWRFNRGMIGKLSAQTLERGIIEFDLEHFQDFPLTRQDESVTFIFANFVDDMLMEISHVIRGNDHLSNTALQLALYKVFNVTPPVFMHLPLLSDVDGKKLSKRADGVSVQQLEHDGFYSLAVAHYLTSMGNVSFEPVNTVDDLIAYLPDNFKSGGAVTYDITALKTLNKKYLNKLIHEHNWQPFWAFINAHAADIAEYDHRYIEQLLALSLEEAQTFAESVVAVRALLHEPVLCLQSVRDQLGDVDTAVIIKQLQTKFEHSSNPLDAVIEVKKWVKESGIKMKVVLSLLRYSVTGSFTGYGINHLCECLGAEMIVDRLKKAYLQLS